MTGNTLKGTTKDDNWNLDDIGASKEVPERELSHRAATGPEKRRRSFQVLGMLWINMHVFI